MPRHLGRIKGTEGESAPGLIKAVPLVFTHCVLPAPSLASFDGDVLAPVIPVAMVFDAAETDAAASSDESGPARMREARRLFKSKCPSRGRRRGEI